MTTDMMGIGGTVLTIVALVLLAAAPIIVLIAVLRLSSRRLSGRRGRHDDLFEGVGRANAMNSHLQAGTPHPDDLAVPGSVGGSVGGDPPPRN